MGLADKMAKMYGKGEKESPAEDEAEGGESAEGERLGSKLKAAIASGDGGMIYDAYRALHAYCNANESS